MTRWSLQNLKWVSGLLIPSLLIEFTAIDLSARAGLLQPLLQLLQPKIERRLISECLQLAEQTLDDFLV